MNRTVRRIIGVMLLAVLVYGGFVAYSGYHELAERLTGFAWWTFAAACGLAFTNYILRFYKWEYYLRLLDIRGIRKSDSFLVFLSGFVLTVTPGKVGEVFKSLLLNDTHRIPIAKTAPIVVAERLTDLIGVIVLIVVGSLGFAGQLHWAGIGTALVVTFLAIVSSERLTTLMFSILEKFPAPIRRLVPKLREAFTSLRVLISPKALVLPTLLSIGAWFLEGFALWMLARGFQSSVAIAPAIFFYSVATLAGAIIPTPGGLGATEGLLAIQLRELGRLDTAAATATTILVRFATLWFAVIVGFVALTLLRMRYPNVHTSAESSTADSQSS